MLGAPNPARAVSITGLSATLLGANSADLYEDTAARKRVRDSQIDVLSSGATSFATRYAADGTGSARSTLGAVTVTRTGAGTLAGSLGLAALPSLQGGATRTGSNGDEAAVRLGLDSALTGFSADDYPGPGSRSLAGDGHFVTVTLVPEPSAWLLVALGLVGIDLFARRHRRRLAAL